MMEGKKEGNMCVEDGRKEGVKRECERWKREKGRNKARRRKEGKGV